MNKTVTLASFILLGLFCPSNKALTQEENLGVCLRGSVSKEIGTLKEGKLEANLTLYWASRY